MDLELDDDQAELQRTVRAFLARECPTDMARRVVETGEPAADLWAAMVKLDWPAIAVPEECGGIGLGFVEVAIVAEELGAVLAPVPFLPTATQYVPAIREAASVQQRSALLGPVARGMSTGALALADHPGRWRPSEVTATAKRVSGGWALHGEKQAVMADSGDTDLVVVTRVGSNGLGLFAVPVADADLRPVRSLDGSRPLSRVGLEGVVVPPERVLGEPGSPEVGRALVRAIEEATTALALETVGTCRALFGLTLAHAKERHQFGVPIGSFQAVKHKLADLHLSVERASALCHLAVAAIAEDGGRRAMACAMAKAASDDCQRLVCQEAIQTFGGIGFTWESDVHLFVKRAKASGALFGGAAEHRLAVAALMGVGRGSTGT